MRRAAKRDKNERAIIDTWEAMGAYVESVSGPGLADTLVHHKGRLFRAEVKGAKRGLTEKQLENFKKAYEAGVPTFIVRTTDDARTLVLGARLLLVWKPEHGSLAGADRKERPFRPGTDKARTVEELCARAGCGRSRSPGLVECAPHAAEVFAAPVVAEAETQRERDRADHDWTECVQRVVLSPQAHSRFLEICADPPDADPEVLATFAKLKR